MNLSRNPLIKSIGSRITHRRKLLGLKGKELAERVGCHPPDITDWEKSKNIPSVESLIKLARALNTTETWLVSGKNPRVAGNGDETSKITRMPIEYKGRVEENNSEIQRQEEMLNDKRRIIDYQDREICDLKSRLAKLEEKMSDESSKKLTG